MDGLPLLWVPFGLCLLFCIFTSQSANNSVSLMICKASLAIVLGPSNAGLQCSHFSPLPLLSSPLPSPHLRVAFISLTLFTSIFLCHIFLLTICWWTYPSTSMYYTWLILASESAYSLTYNKTGYLMLVLFSSFHSEGLQWLLWITLSCHYLSSPCLKSSVKIMRILGICRCSTLCGRF